jgi:TolB-like protein
MAACQLFIRAILPPIVLLIVVGPAAAADPARPPRVPTLIVFNIVPEKGIEQGLANLLTEVVIDNVAKNGRYHVIGQKDIEKMVFWEQNKQLQGCTDTSCLVQIAGAMGAEYYVEGSVGAVGRQYVLTLKLISSRDVEVVHRLTRLIERNEDVMMKAIVEMAQEVAAAGSAGAARPIPAKATLSEEAPGRDRGKPTVVMFDIVPEKGVEQSAANLLTEIVADNVAKVGRYKMIGQKDISKMMFWEENKQLHGCTDTSCMVQIAGAMGAAYYIEGSVGRMGSKYVLTMKFIDTRSVRVLARSTKYIDRSEDAMVKAAVEMVEKDELFGARELVPVVPGQDAKRDTQGGLPAHSGKGRATIIVFNVVPEKGVEKSAASVLTDVIVGSIEKLGLYKLFSQKDIQKMVFYEQNKQLRGCTDTACMVQIAGAMGADYYVESSVGAMGSQYALTIKLIDSEKVEVVRRSTQLIEKDEDQMVKTVLRMLEVEGLFGGRIEVPISFELDKKRKEEKEKQRQEEFRKQWQAEGPLGKAILERREQEKRRSEKADEEPPADAAVVVSESEPERWYSRLHTKWWFWTAVGVVVVGAGVGTYFLVSGGSPDHVAVKTNWQP